MKIDWKTVIVGGMMGVVVAGCSTQPATSTAATSVQTHDPDARSFQGTIVSLRPMKSTMLISKDERQGRDAYPNIIQVKYDANTKFYLDNQPTTLDKLQQYMTCRIAGHMRDGQLVAEDARFSSILPPNVKPSGQATAQ